MFTPNENASEKHEQAKERLAEICRQIGMQTEIEARVETDGKTYHCDVLASFNIFESQIKLDLEVEDFDHSKHDFDDAENKAKELARYFIRTIWFKSSQLIGKKPAQSTDVLIKIFDEMIDGHYRNPRMNI